MEMATWLELIYEVPDNKILAIPNLKELQSSNPSIPILFLVYNKSKNDRESKIIQ